MPARTVKAALALAVVSSWPWQPVRRKPGTMTGEGQEEAGRPGQGVCGDGQVPLGATAVKHGFKRTDECADLPGVGGMGYHYVNQKNVVSTNPARPAALLYKTNSKG